jgi:phage-related minor tail protein
MADDIQIKLGLDASQLFNGLDVALKKVNDGIKGLPDVGDAIASDLPSAQNKLNSFVNEQKQLLVALRLQGKEGSDSYAEIEKSIKEANVELKKMDDATKAVNASFQEVESSAGGIGGVFQGLKGGLSDAFSGGLIGSLAGGGLAAGVQAGIGAVVDGFGAVMDAGRGLISAQGDLQAQTGATGAEFEALKNAADEAFLGGVGESVAEATKIISNAKTVLKDALPTEQIGAFTAKAQALGNLYDKDVNEVISKSTPFIKQFGLDGETAFNLIALAAKEGKTSQDDVLDTLAEYSGLLDEAGFSAEEFTGALVVAGQEGLFNTDKIADSIKEAQIRLKAGDTAKAFTDIKNQLPEALGSTLGNLEQLASSGQITIKEFLQKSGESIKTAFDAGQISEAMTTQLQVAIAGTPAEEIGVDTYNKIFAAPIPTDEITKRATEAGQAASNAVGQYLSFDAVGRNLSLAFEKGSAMVVSGLSTTFGMIAEAVGPTMSNLMDTLTGYWERLWSVIGPIAALIGGSIISNIVYALNAVMVTVDIVYSVLSEAFDAIANALQPLIQVFKEAFGLDGALGEGMDVMQMFQDGLKLMTEIMREVGGIIADFGGLIIEFLITPLQTVIEVIADVVRSIAGWMQSNDKNTESVKQSGEAVNKSKGFIDTLRQAFDNIRGTIGGVRESFIQIKTTIGEFWDAITQLDLKKALEAFTGFGDKVNDAYDRGFNKTKETIKATAEAQKKAVEDTKKTGLENFKFTELTEEQKKKLEEEKKKKDPAGKKPAGEPSESEYKKALARYKSYIDGIEIYRKEQVTKFEQQGLNKEEIQLKLSQDPNAAPTADALTKTIENTFGTTRDAQGNLVLGVKLGKTENIAEATLNVRKLLTEVGKFEVNIPVKIPDFKDVIKEFDTLAKDIAKTSESLVPTVLATSQEALDGTIATVQQYIDFIKLQNDEIALKQAEALAAGNEEAAAKFGESIQTNIQNINLLSSRLERFGTDSKAAIEKAALESTLQFQIQTALQTSILDAFNSEKIRKEKEANDAIREERLGALNAEEDDLTNSLAKREISFEEYSAKIGEINEQRQKAVEETEIGFAKRFKTVIDQTASQVATSQSKIYLDAAKERNDKQVILDKNLEDAKKELAALSGKGTFEQFAAAQEKINKAQEDASKNEARIYGIRTADFNEFVGNTLSKFSELAASGKATLADFGNAAAGAAFDAVSKMIPSFVVGILGSSITTLGPIAGPLIAATLTAGLQLLLANARGALGFKDGVVGLEGPGDERSDSIPAWLSKGESVITAAGTRANREELEWMNNNPGMSIRDYFTSNAPQVRYSVQEDGNLIQEVRKLREETRGLGKQINRNTHVEISGALVADNNSIKAVIERDRRRNARRG